MNRERICRNGYRVWLTAGPKTLFQRIRGDQTTADRRPALSGLNDYDEIVSMLAFREPLYAEVAQKIVDTENATAEAICDDIADWLKTRSG